MDTSRETILECPNLRAVGNWTKFDLSCFILLVDKRAIAAQILAVC